MGAISQCKAEKSENFFKLDTHWAQNCEFRIWIPKDRNTPKKNTKLCKSLLQIVRNIRISPFWTPKIVKKRLFFHIFDRFWHMMPLLHLKFNFQHFLNSCFCSKTDRFRDIAYLKCFFDLSSGGGTGIRFFGICQNVP